MKVYLYSLPSYETVRKSLSIKMLVETLSEFDDDRGIQATNHTTHRKNCVPFHMVRSLRFDVTWQFLFPVIGLFRLSSHESLTVCEEDKL